MMESIPIEDSIYYRIFIYYLATSRFIQDLYDLLVPAILPYSLMEWIAIIQRLQSLFSIWQAD